MDPLELVKMPGLMALTRGRDGGAIAPVAGPALPDHPARRPGGARPSPGISGAAPVQGSEACRHGTFVAGILGARRGARAPAVAPHCTLLVRPVFSEMEPSGELPSTTPGELAEAIVDCVDAGAWILNLSAALVGGSLSGGR